MLVSAYFAESGVPKTGLSPTVDIIDLSDNSVDVNDGAMDEVGAGFYKYDFSAVDVTKQYSVIADSVTLTGNERYAVTTIDNIEPTAVEIRDAILDDATRFSGADVAALAAARGEPAQGAPPVSASQLLKIDYIYKFMRNLSKVNKTTGFQEVYNDAGDTVDHKSAVSDDGNIFSRGEFISGA